MSSTLMYNVTYQCSVMATQLPHKHDAVQGALLNDTRTGLARLSTTYQFLWEPSITRISGVM